MTKRGKSNVIKLCVLVAITLFLLPSMVSAHVDPYACRLFGEVTFCDENVPDGTVVTAWLEGPHIDGPWSFVLYKEGGVTYYRIDVGGDDPNTPTKEGGVEGETVYFGVNIGGNVIVAATGTFERVGFVHHALRLPCCIPGDANGDGVVDTGDITKVKRIIMGLDDPTCGADANQDGVIDTGDITKIKLIIMGLDC